jgi:hypothetical protein
MICGEVVANESGGGPRLMIDVVPFDKGGRVESFTGRISLVMTGANADGKQSRICGWEFGPNDVRAAVEPDASEPTMRFYVQLPDEAPIDQPAVLWARLVPLNGAKLFAHAKIDLTRPGVFSSHTSRFQQLEESAVATETKDLVAPATFDEPLPPPEVDFAGTAQLRDLEELPVGAPSIEEQPVTDVASSLNEGQWAVALPGKPANLPPEARDESGAGGWRASSEPIPIAIPARSEPPAAQKEPPRKPEVRQTDVEAESVEAKSTVVRPSWTAERGSGSPRSVATRPGWSATR